MKISNHNIHCNRTSGRRGFALIATLLVTSLLVLLVMALLSLAAVGKKQATAGLAREQARANARLALNLAIGDLQKQTGTDTRVTARADILDKDVSKAVQSAPVLGAWKSWEGTDHETSGVLAGRPIPPKSGGDYAAAKNTRFLRWLVSGSANGFTDPTAVPDTKPADGKVTLVGPGSVGSGRERANQQVHLPPTAFGTGKKSSAVAWWIGGENQKARLPVPYKPAADTVAAWSAVAKSHTQADPAVFRMDGLLQDATPATKAVTLQECDLFTTADKGLPVAQGNFHDLSTASIGLLTNTATGGWRKDLSLLTENRALLAKSGLPLFRLSPGKDILYNLPVRGGGYRPDKSLFYPWSGYRDQGIPIYEHGAVTSWENLLDWATLYKSMASDGTRLVARSYRIDSNDAAGNYDFLHQVRVIPVIARVQWVFSHSAVKTNATAYAPRLIATPVLTMWNPYNVSITSKPLVFKLFEPLPNAFRYNVGGVQNQKWNSLMPSLNTNPAYLALYGGRPLTFQIKSGYTFKPGETLLFSPLATPVAASATAELQPGFRKQGGHYFPLLKDDGSPLTVPAAAAGSTTVKVEAKFDTIHDDGTTIGKALGVGVYLDMEIDNYRHLAYRMVYKPDVAAAVYPALAGLAQATIAQSSIDPQPFLTTIFGARTASRTHLAAKGLVQSNPLVNYTAMGFKDIVEYNIRWDYAGTDHPVNSPFDYSFEKLSGAGGDAYPNTDPANHGFIVTGFQSADGLSRCVLAELPAKPLQSLAELQNWDVRYENPIPPYAFNIIGNSDATPLIPANAVVNPKAPATVMNLQHDDFFCANHLLFDDWFVSSLAPKSAKPGKPAATETLKKTYTDFVSGKDPLENRAYQALAEDRAAAQTSPAGADTLFTKHVNQAHAWKTIASRLEVAGMFNVNSTSVAAWRALLGHARGHKIPYTAANGSLLTGALDYPFSRFSVAGDTEAKGKDGLQPSSGQFSACSEFAGYRMLDAAALDRLAEEVVKQVRQRGPFLSLAEFVNRQLSSGDLAMAGTIQAALNALAKDTPLNPFAVLQNGSKPSSGTPPAAGSTEYAFPAAAAGYNAYGLPGWTRQADVLRPLAPVLSARDDTFTIRAYGDARDATGKITARATCEAVVRRVRDYVDGSDAADITTLPKSSLNLAFGRRYQILSFRWLSPEEI